MVRTVVAREMTTMGNENVFLAVIARNETDSGTDEHDGHEADEPIGRGLRGQAFYDMCDEQSSMSKDRRCCSARAGE